MLRGKFLEVARKLRVSRSGSFAGCCVVPWLGAFHAFENENEDEDEDNYRVELIYLRLRSVRLAIERVKARVAQGGHHVPAAVIRRRFHQGWRNFEELYRPLVNYWELHDNSGTSPILIQRRG